MANSGQEVKEIGAALIPYVIHWCKQSHCIRLSATGSRTEVQLLDHPQDLLACLRLDISLPVQDPRYCSSRNASGFSHIADVHHIDLRSPEQALRLTTCTELLQNQYTMEYSGARVDALRSVAIEARLNRDYCRNSSSRTAWIRGFTSSIAAAGAFPSLTIWLIASSTPLNAT